MPRKKSSLSEPITKEYLGEVIEGVILPGVDALMEKRIKPLEAKIDEGFIEMRAGFADIKKSIQVLGGDMAELKEDKKDHEKRIQVIEQEVGIRR